jgi:hypothetical protein
MTTTKSFLPTAEQQAAIDAFATGESMVIEAGGDAREVYSVSAKNEQDARDKFEQGELPQPYITEVSGSFITSIEEEKEV